MNGFCRCPRCGDQAFERLETYAHCIACLYFEDHFHDSERAYYDARAAEKLLEEEDPELDEQATEESIAS